MGISLKVLLCYAIINVAMRGAFTRLHQHHSDWSTYILEDVIGLNLLMSEGAGFYQIKFMIALYCPGCMFYYIGKERKNKKQKKTKNYIYIENNNF